jgi:hypothetical protein
MIWKDFIAAHTAVLAGFFIVEVLTWRGPFTKPAAGSDGLLGTESLLTFT